MTSLAPSPAPSPDPTPAESDSSFVGPSDTAFVTRAISVATAVVALGVAVSMRDGTYAPWGIGWLTVSLVGFAIALGGQLQRFGTNVPQWALVVALAFGIAVQCAMAMFGCLVRYFHGSETAALGNVFLFTGGVFALPLLLAGPSLRVAKVLFPLILLVWLAAGIWFIHWRPNPAIDVFMFQQDSSRALLHGENPYRLTFPNPYGQDSPFYGPGVSVNNVLQFGYPYMPTTLLMVLPAYGIAGDYRYAQLVALLASSALIAYAKPSRIGFLAAGLFLTSPRNYYMMEAGWTEPLQLLLLTGTVFAAVRRSAAMPYLLGILLASKLYMPFAVFLTPLLLRGGPREWVSPLVKAAVAGLAISLPLILWDLPAFMNSAVTLQFRQPFRWDALSYLAWSVSGRQDAPNIPSAAWAFVAMAVAIGLCLWRLPKTPAGFALGVAVTYGAFFAFNKQAFVNYYYLVIGAGCCAIAILNIPEGDPPDFLASK